MAKFNIKKEVSSIIIKYRGKKGEALDGDEAENLLGHIRNEINLHEGNITNEEYTELENGKR